MVNGKTKSPVKGFTIFYIIASVLVIITLAGLLIYCQTRKTKEDLCLCFGSQAPGTERCVDPARVQRAYYSGRFLPQFMGV